MTKVSVGRSPESFGDGPAARKGDESGATRAPTSKVARIKLLLFITGKRWADWRNSFLMVSVFHVSSLMGEVIVVSFNKNGESKAAAFLATVGLFPALTNGYEGATYGFGGPS